MLIRQPKSSDSLPIKHSIGGPPTEELLQTCLEQAYEKRRSVEVSWLLPDPDTLYQLFLSLDPNGGEPIWVLKKGPPPPPPVQPGELKPRYIPPAQCWTHQTGYVSLIAETCILECGGKVNDDVSIAESVIGIKGGQAIPATNYKPMIFGVTESGDLTAPPRPPTPNPTQPTPAAWGAPAQSGPPTTGDLATMSPVQLVKDIMAAGWTGCMRFQADGSPQLAQIFFNAGTPVHAMSLTSSGDSGFLDLLTWQRGKFHWVASIQSDQQTMTGNHDALLNEARNIFEQMKTITSAGVSLESVIRRKQSLSSEAEFEEMIESRGVLVDMQLQKQLFLSADGTASPVQILQKFGVTRAQCVALVYNLVTCDLISP